MRDPCGFLPRRVTASIILKEISAATGLPMQSEGHGESVCKLEKQFPALVVEAASSRQRCFSLVRFGSEGAAGTAVLACPRGLRLGVAEIVGLVAALVIGQ